MTDFEKYIDLLLSTKREGIEDLVEYIKTTDFEVAPASTKFHEDSHGGLCKHSLNVYKNMSMLCKEKEIDIPEDSIIITSLLHDISKTNFYKEISQNKKVYSSAGSKRDELGNFDWVASKGYAIKEPMDRDVIIGDHGTNSFYIANKFIKLSDAEASAIINHHAGKDNNYMLRDLNEAMNRYPTLTMLHISDLLATYIDENIYMIDE